MKLKDHREANISGNGVYGSSGSGGGNA